MTGRLIIIEAGDGSGKATQTEQLCRRLTQEGYRVSKVEFPNYESQSSALIKMYLQGQFGKEAVDVNPYAASTFYAVDRFASYKTEWESFLQDGGIVVCDRYTTSNMVHQAVKIADEGARIAFLDWLWDFEFNKMGLPVPDQVILLDMPPVYSQRLLVERASKAGFTEKDIHEKDQAYLERCYTCYQEIAKRYGWHVVHCVQNGVIKGIEQIHEEVYCRVAGLLTDKVRKATC